MPEWGRIVDGTKIFTLHEGQRDIMRSKARFKAAVAGTGGGKTALGPVWVMQQIQRCLAARPNQPVLGLIVAPSYPIMARATGPTLVSLLAGTGMEGKYVESRNRYYLPGGVGILWLMSADKPWSLEGGQFDFAWIDEGGQLRYDAWVAIQGRLGQKMGPVLITTTPYGENWLKSQFFDLYVNGDKDYYVRQWASVENPAYPQEEYDRARRTMSVQRFAMRYDGEFMRMAGLVYPGLRDRIEEFESVPPGRRIGGIDFGWNNPFGAVSATVDADNMMWVHYERYMRCVPIDDHARAIPKKVEWFADSSEPAQIYDLRKYGHTCRPNRVKSIAKGIDAVNARIMGDTIRIHPTCRAIISEADEYRYPEKDDVFVGENPIGGSDHALDALRYMISSHDIRHKPRHRGAA